MTTRLDPAIAADLDALVADSKRDMPPVEEAFNQLNDGAYRDGTAGAEARRDHLLAKRRLELALMPLAVGRVFTHRVSRAAAGATATVAGLVTAALIADPTLFRLAAFFVPGLNLSLLAAFTAIAALAAYAIATLIAERVFDRQMRECIEASPDAFEDLDSLARGPLARARALAHRADGFATALPLIAVSLCAPLFTFLALAFSRFGVGRYQFAPESTVYVASEFVGSNLGFIFMAMTAGAALAIFLGRACQREHRMISKPTLVRGLSHWAVIPASLVLGLIVLVVLGRGLTGLSAGHLPSEDMRLFVSVAGLTAVMAPSAWIALLLRRSEEKRLEAAG